MNDLQTLKSTLAEFLNAIQQVLQSGERLSDNFQGQIAQFIGSIFDRIQQLESEQGPPSAPTPPLEPNPIGSSNVNSFGYDEKTGRLMVKFQGDYPQQNGPVYAYEGVPKAIFELFKRGAVPARTDGKNAWGKWWKGKVPSLGASMFTLIKGGGYPYQRMT